MDVLAFLTLDIQRPNISAIVYGMQGDRQSRAIRAQLVDGSTQWTPPAGTFFVISYAKPDGTHGIYSQTEAGNAAVTVSGSVATIALAEQVLTVAGDVPMTLTMFSADGERLSAFTWLLIVKPAAYSDAAFMSTDYYNLLTEQITAMLKAQESITGLTATATTLAAGSAATVTVTGGTGAEDPFHFVFGIPKGNTGSKGATGTAATITAQIVEYQSGTSGTTAPTGAWSTTVPTVPAGQYLWTRSTVTFNSGSPVVSYSVSRMGVDGTGSVKTVNNQSPDSSGDILLSSSNIPTPDFSSITAALAAKANSTDVTLEKLGAASNPNLLDNPWFTVNQRGQTTYTHSGGGFAYTIDRWKIQAGMTVNVTSNGITLIDTVGSKNFEQVIEIPSDMYGKTMTLSVMGSNTVSLTFVMPQITATVPTTIATKTGGQIVVNVRHETAATLRIYIRCATVNTNVPLTAVKFEYGSVSTLANDHAPDLVTELLKCQRYYFKSATTTNNMFLGDTGAGSKAPRFHVPVPVPMYSGSTLTVSVLATTSYAVTPIASKNIGKPTVATAVNNGSEVYVTLSETAAISDTAYQLCSIQTTVSISADL